VAARVQEQQLATDIAGLTTTAHHLQATVRTRRHQQDQGDVASVGPSTTETTTPTADGQDAGSSTVAPEPTWTPDHGGTEGDGGSTDDQGVPVTSTTTTVPAPDTTPTTSPPTTVPPTTTTTQPPRHGGGDDGGGGDGSDDGGSDD
jgi:hypothetical protein